MDVSGAYALVGLGRGMVINVSVGLGTSRAKRVPVGLGTDVLVGLGTCMVGCLQT